jgi:hypothetical protein
MEELQLSDIKQLHRIVDEVSTFRIYMKIYFAGIFTTFILGTALTMMVLFIYLFYEFNIYESISRQIPLDIRKKYRSKILVFVKWIDRVASESLSDEQ